MHPDGIKIWSTDQVYKGVSVENPRANWATVATSGQILCYNGNPIAAFYHSDAAGMTEDPKYVWGGGFPYLAPVCELSHDSPHSLWEVIVKKDEISGFLKEFDLTGECLDIVPESPGESGRWSSVSFLTSKGEFTVKPTEFRNITGLKSLLFSLYYIGGNKNIRGLVNPLLPIHVSGEENSVETALRSTVILGKDGIASTNGDGAML